MFRLPGLHRGWVFILSLATTLVFSACGGGQSTSESPTVADETTCSALSPDPTPRILSGDVTTASVVNTFCGTVSIDGQPAPDGTRIRFGLDALSGLERPLCDTTTTSGNRFHVTIQFNVSPYSGGCEPGLYVRVAGRWTNERVEPGDDGAVRTLNLTVTSPPTFYRIGASPDDEGRMYNNGPFCEPTGRPHGYVYEVRDTNGGSLYAVDNLAIAGATV